MRPGRRFEEPLEVPDPIDPGRNVASALSIENMMLFAHACKSYLERPALEFFYPMERCVLTADEAKRLMKERGTHFLALLFKVPDVVDDILYPQLRNCAQAVAARCGQGGFSSLGSAFEVLGGKAAMLFEFEVSRLPETAKHLGPPAWLKNSGDFIKRWTNDRDALSRPFIEGDHWTVFVRRRFTTVGALIRESLGELSLGKDLGGSIKE